ncbi:MAG: hypothetical protein WDW38_005080 [Sanguina aurantia]
MGMGPVKLLEKEKSDKARRTKSLEARTAKDVKRTLERGNKGGPSAASRAAEQQQQQAARQRSRREGRNYWRHKVSSRDRYEIGPGFRASSRIGKILSDLGNEADWASQVILRHQMATIIQAIIRGYLLRKHWRASPDAVVADLKATQRAAKAEVTRRAGLRLQLQLAATNEKLKAKAGDVQLPMIGKGALGRHGAAGSSKDGTAGAGAGPVKKGLWAGSSKKVVVTAKDEGNDSNEEVRESESDVSDLDEDDIAMAKLRAQTPPWQKLESSAGEGQWAKLNNKSQQGRLDMLWDSQESLARMGAIKGRRMERDPSEDEIAIARGKYDLEAPLSPNLISALLVDRRSLRVSAALTASSAFLGQRVSPAVAARTCVRQARPSNGRLVVKAMFERFTEKAIKVVMLAQEEARRLGHNFVGTEQLLLGLVGESTGIAAKVLKSMGVNLKDARVERVLEMSLEEARQLGHNYIGTEHILLGLLREGEGVAARVLETLGADPAKIRTQVIRMVGESQEAVGAGAGAGAGGGAAGSNKLPTLSEYGTNLTNQALEGKLDPVVGRKKQIERVIQILGRRTKNNPCLIGEPGVGKTAVAEGLATKIATGDCPETIDGKQVITLDMGLLVAGTKYRGEFEERLKKLMEEVKQNPDIILMIDEVHTLIGAGAAEGAIDAANILKPALARGELQCIGATTIDEYRKHIEKDPALERRFQPVTVPEPSVDETFEILQGLRERYEAHHKLRYTDEALMAAAKMSSQYISDRFLPDKAIDLIDEAGSRVRLRHIALPEEARELDKELKIVSKDKDAAVRGQDFEKAGSLRDKEMELKAKISAVMAGAKEQGKAEEETVEGGGPTVTDQDIANIVAQWTGIPIEKVSADETERLIKMEEVLHGRVIGQEEAVSAIARAIRRARVGLKSPNRPIASFIFAGPTGVGKSELAKTLANYYFGSEEAMVRLDMSEFMERHTVSKLIGSPPGYVGYSEGGQLTEAVRRKPYTVVLFDEIEKAHPDVFNMMLQILEDGRLTDSKGRTIDFKNTLIIMTSNVGSSVIEKGGRSMGFFLRPDDEDMEQDMSYSRIKTLVGEELKTYFRPEFLNRLDEIIVFRQLTKKEVKQIADIFLRDVFKRAEERKIKIEVTEKFKDRLVDEGFNPTYGARPLRRAIMRLIEDCLAERILMGDIKEGDVVIMDVDPDGAIAVLAGDKKMRQMMDSTPAGIA